MGEGDVEDEVDAYHGFLYVKAEDNVARFIFDLDGNLAGIQTAIPGDMKGYNSFNETIKVPPKEVIPPILLSDDTDGHKKQLYTVTAYFKHPRLICSPYAKNAHPGKGLYIQMGYVVEQDFMRIPMESRHLGPEWKKGSCRPQMGVHYFRNLSPDLPCEMLYPVFLMYNQDGLLGAFGWLFQGTPPTYSRQVIGAQEKESELSWFKLYSGIYPFTFDVNMLPSCMFNPDFRVFGLRIYLRNKESMICPIHTPGPAARTITATTTTTHRPYRHPRTRSPLQIPSSYTTLKPPSYDDTIILDDIIRERENSASAVTLGYSYHSWAVRCGGVILTLLGLHALLMRLLVGNEDAAILAHHAR
ncbi:uncharacterized protein [Littorina saxatilis]|uniref:uncharacterized protein n=1 Tax=Littorina saxatilis TaxID=31220 RepID=UPI0038B67A9E